MLKSSSTDIPESVSFSLSACIANINRWNRMVESARKTDIRFSGGGRYVWESTGGIQNSFTSEMTKIAEFSSIAIGKGIDPQPVLNQLGFEHPLQLRNSEKN